MPVARLLDSLAPPVCAACRAYAGRADPLCADCRGGLRWLGQEVSVLSGVAVWAPLAYDGPARALVSALKFRGAVRAADVMAAQIVAGVQRGSAVAGGAPPCEKTSPTDRTPPKAGAPLSAWLEDATLVPVPLHRSRRRRRGFNQATLLAAALATRTGLPVADCLVRQGRGTTQVGRGRAERAQAIEGAVAVRPDTEVPEHVVLIDDVVTTGATLAACATALRAAGARSVRATTYARTPGR